MSSAHKDHEPGKWAYAELDRLLPILEDWLQQPYRLVRSFDIPWLGGYNRDGSLIYLDRHVPAFVKVKGVSVDLLTTIAGPRGHERIEVGIMNLLKASYNYAHEVATVGEHRLVQQLGVDPLDYEQVVQEYVREDEHEKLIQTPPDLDLRGYIENNERELIAKIKAARIGR